MKTWDEVRDKHVRLVGMPKEPDPLESLVQAFRDGCKTLMPAVAAFITAAETFYTALDIERADAEPPRCGQCGRTWPEHGDVEEDR